MPCCLVLPPSAAVARNRSLETSLRLLAFVVCDLIILRPYVLKSDVDAANSEIINHIHSQKENTTGRPWAASQAQSKRPPCCRKLQRPSKSPPPPKFINTSSANTVPKHPKTEPKRTQHGRKTATWASLGRLGGSWVYFGGSLVALCLRGGALGLS